jgi:glutamate-ammonia-ligase adenylyltransferase
MYSELQDRMGLSPRGESLENLIRKYRQREMVRIAYRDLAGLADSLEISRELSALASACLHAALNWTRPECIDLSQEPKERLQLIALGKLGSRQLHFASDLDLVFLYDAVPAAESPNVRAAVQKEQDTRVEKILELLSAVTPEGITYSVDLRLRPGGSSSMLARTWESVFNYSEQYMQPWERMAMVRSRLLGDSVEHRNRWESFVSKVVYGYSWNEEAFESIRHIKRRIETEISKETRSQIDFKYGKGGIADLEFLVQFLQIKHGGQHPGARAPELNDAVLALCEAEIVTEEERDTMLRAHQFERMVENRYQLMEEWTSREVSRESPTLSRLAASIGYKGDVSMVRKAFISDWDEITASVRQLVDRYFYA